MELEKQRLDKWTKYAVCMVLVAVILILIDVTLIKNILLVNSGLILIFVAFLLFVFIAVKAYLANRKYQTKEFTPYYSRVIIALVVGLLIEWLKKIN